MSRLADKYDKLLACTMNLIESVDWKPPYIVAAMPMSRENAVQEAYNQVQAAATDLRAEFVRIGAQYAIENPEETAEQRIRELNEDIESQEKQLNKANRALGNLKKYTEGTNETD
ncbi:hypothetical protein QR680_007229 [Steinernema hermaphroditum]|uniref:Uncharacterized protein n=1 Tax=Steinernema hermaphroditum TaxID=289476 RepID=A0AA39HY21_9BILA|nr:hypothetical protein QR680_007229 [Steinernema hermaphroditum]